MGYGCCYEPKEEKRRTNLKNDIENDFNRIERKENLCNFEINKLKKSIDDAQNNILKTIQKGDLKITEQINEYYNLLNEKYQIEDKYHLNSLIEEKKNLKYLKEELEQDTLSIKKINEIEAKYDQIKNNLKNNLFINEEISVSNSYFLNNEEKKEKQNLINFCNLNEQVIKEIEGIENRKENFLSLLFENINNEYVFPSFQNTLNKYKTEFENSVDSFEKKLNSFPEKIKTKIEEIIKKEKKPNDANNIFDDLNKEIKNAIISQNNLENELH